MFAASSVTSREGFSGRGINELIEKLKNNIHKQFVHFQTLILVILLRGG